MQKVSTSILIVFTFNCISIRFAVLGETLQEDSFKLRMIKDAIFDFLSQKRESDEFEETLTKLAGNDVYPLFTICELLKKLTTQMERLLTHPSIKFLEDQASTVLSSPMREILIDQGQWMDDLSYPRKLNELCPGEKLFLCVYDQRSQKMSIKRVFGETQESSDFNRISPVQQKELITSLQQLNRNPVFLKRSRGVKNGEILNSSSQMPKSLQFDNLRYHVSSEIVRIYCTQQLQVLAFCLVSLQTRNSIHDDFIEQEDA